MPSELICDAYDCAMGLSISKTIVYVMYNKVDNFSCGLTDYDENWIEIRWGETRDADDSLRDDFDYSGMYECVYQFLPIPNYAPTSLTDTIAVFRPWQEKNGNCMLSFVLFLIGIVFDLFYLCDLKVSFEMTMKGNKYK